MLSGNVLQGICYALALIPIIPEMIEAVNIKENVREDNEFTQEKISDLSSGIYGSFSALGSFSAPIIGGLLVGGIGF